MRIVHVTGAIRGTAAYKLAGVGGVDGSAGDGVIYYVTIYYRH